MTETPFGENGSDLSIPNKAAWERLENIPV
jgi:hypothetical protein